MNILRNKSSLWAVALAAVFAVGTPAFAQHGGGGHGGGGGGGGGDGSGGGGGGGGGARQRWRWLSRRRWRRPHERRIQRWRPHGRRIRWWWRPHGGRIRRWPTEWLWWPCRRIQRSPEWLRRSSR